MNNSDYIEIEPENNPLHSIIWMHGLGADGNDFVPIVAQLMLPSKLGIRFIFPHAPIMPVTINNGQKMRSWFDIIALTTENGINELQLNAATKSINGLIEREVSRGITTNNIILAGFSQGATLALTTGINFQQSLGGVIALSGFLPKSMTKKATHTLPIFLAHGIYDPVVPYALGKMTYTHLNDAGYNIDWHSYPMQHSVCGNEINDISAWIQAIWR